MRLDAGVRRCVVLLGHAADNKEENFIAAGTGFLVEWKGFRYLVTAHHVAVGLGEGPFHFRVNKTGGETSDTVYCDPEVEPEMRWILHPDPDVDLAVTMFHFDAAKHELDLLAISGRILLSDDEMREQRIGVGDLCHAVGLFRLLQGQRRNLPVVHTGFIALMAGEELIPVQNWLGPGTKQVNNHLVQIQNLKGLSGAPVIVRGSREFVAQEFRRVGKGETEFSGAAYAAAYDADAYVLGVWSASWDGISDQTGTTAYGGDRRVPIGFGTVVPCQRLIELLDSEAVAARRTLWLEVGKARNAGRQE